MYDIYIYLYCKQTVASTLITDPLVKTPLPAAKLLKRQLLVFPQVATRVSQEATKACRKRNAKGLPQPRPTTVTTWQHHESHPPFHLRLPEPKGACKERWIPWIMVMWNAFIVMCKDVEFTLPKILWKLKKTLIIAHTGWFTIWFQPLNPITGCWSRLKNLQLVIQTILSKSQSFTKKGSFHYLCQTIGELCPAVNPS